MLVPDAFTYLCKFFHQDVYLDFPSLEAAAKDALESFDEEEKIAIRAFLDEALSGKYSSEELHQMMISSPADNKPGNAQASLELLKAIRDLVNE